ncbi:MAG: AzlC family ABC transporter permease [Acidimicrobiia bacterium]
MNSSDLRAGAVAVLPMLVAVVPFGLVAGATPVADGLGGGAAVGLSVIVFAGASQLAAADVLADGGSALVAVAVAWTINLRLVLYSASLAGPLAHEPFPRRLGAAYLLTDQAYALSVTRFAAGAPPERRLGFYLGTAIPLWVAWQASTIMGVGVGSALADELPLDFALPLSFLVLLIPALETRPAAVAAAAGGLGAVIAAEAGADALSVLAGAVAGIAAGAIAEAAGEPR